MKQWRGKLLLDKEMLGKTPAYYIYRSEEMRGRRPMIDGVYIQRDAIGSEAPDEITGVFEWDTP
jgi:hypothetical protein